MCQPTDDATHRCHFFLGPRADWMMSVDDPHYLEGDQGKGKPRILSVQWACMIDPCCRRLDALHWTITRSGPGLTLRLAVDSAVSASVGTAIYVPLLIAANQVP